MNKRPLVRIDEDLYQIVKLIAETEDRSIDKTVNRALRQVLNAPKNTPSPENLKGQNFDKVIINETATAPQVADLIKNNSEATPTPIEQLDQIDELIAEGEDLEKPCCKNPNQPCKHWVWDVSTGEGYVNSLSGRFMEVE